VSKNTVEGKSRLSSFEQEERERESEREGEKIDRRVCVKEKERGSEKK
jgi:hypothetical protein